MRAIIVGLVCVAVGSGCAGSKPAAAEKAGAPAKASPTGEKDMQLGNFSVSLAVKDLQASRAFYENLGFKARGGNGTSWLVMQNDTAIIGLFQGMFPKNILTFNPGWDRDRNTPANFDDVRDLQKALKAKGIPFAVSADEASTGPASFMIVDPDGNQILVDQHVPKPAKK